MIFDMRGSNFFLTSLASLGNQSCKCNAFLTLCSVSASFMIYFMAMAYAQAN